MPIFPEREKPIQDEIREIPELPEIPPHIEKAGVTPTQTQFTSQVVDDNGQNLIQTPSSQTVTIAIPADQRTLRAMSTGSKNNAIVWFGAFWLRMIKKAIHFGWKLVTKSQG